MSDPRCRRTRTFSPRTLWRLGWRYLTRHPWQSALMIIGVALGVAVVVAVDLASASARRAFDLSVDAVVGRATHQIVGSPRGFDESIYVNLQRSGVVQAAAPIIDAYVTAPELGDRPLQLLGVDPFAERPFRTYFSSSGTVRIEDMTAFLHQPGAILLSSDIAEHHSLSPGANIVLNVAGWQRHTTLVGLLQPADHVSRRALEGVVLADVATAQELTGRLGRLDRVDLILPEGEDQVVQIQAVLPEGVRVQPVEQRTGSTRQMTAAFRLNLTALSLLALIVGIFLIFNTTTFSVVQRRPLFAVIRCIGVTRSELFVLVLGEALLIGVLGVTFGLPLGVVMGRSAVQMVTQTIADLYFVLTVRAVGLPLVSLVKGALLGIVATVLAAIAPAHEATRVAPGAALLRSGLEDKARRAAVSAFLAGLTMILLGIAVLFFPTGSIVVSFGATFLVVLGFSLLTPSATRHLMTIARWPLGQMFGSVGRMAPRDVSKSLSRTGVAVAALMVAMSVTIGISLMITSFRQTVSAWLDHALQGDVVVSGATGSNLQDVTPIDPEAYSVVAQHAKVVRVDLLRSVTVNSPVGPVDIEAGSSPDYGQDLRYLDAEGSPHAVWEAVHRDGEVIISEPLANRLGLSASDSLELYAEDGLRSFSIAGIYYDYASTGGTAIMSLDTYRRAWLDDTLTALIVELEENASADQVARALEEELASVQSLLARSNRTIRRMALSVFDRTFAITDALQALATMVAFMGVLSALLGLQLEKQRELGIMRAIGLTVREVRGLILLETGLMGVVAGVLSVPAGLALAVILIRVINRRSFGWTLQMNLTPTPFIHAILLSLLAALIAGAYPALRTGKTGPADALRYE